MLTTELTQRQKPLALLRIQPLDQETQPAPSGARPPPTHTMLPAPAVEALHPLHLPPSEDPAASLGPPHVHTEGRKGISGQRTSSPTFPRAPLTGIMGETEERPTKEATTTGQTPAPTPPCAAQALPPPGEQDPSRKFPHCTMGMTTVLPAQAQ